MKKRIIQTLIQLTAATLLLTVLLTVIGWLIGRPTSPAALLLLFLASAILALLGTVALAYPFADRIVAPLRHLNLTRPLENDAYEELTPLLNRLESQRLEIKSHLRMMREKQNEFAAITENMREGLIVLDDAANILSINKSALAMFDVHGHDHRLQPIHSVSSSEQLHSAVDKALDGESSEEIFAYHQYQYQVLSSPILIEGAIRGAVLLILDVTERQATEQIRREFSANVSHELKTPLTSISGYAEIMKDGLVQPADVSRFSGRIYDEAKRLIALVEDIINLSRLDEADFTAPQEEIDILTMATAAAKLLWPLAEEKSVTLDVSGERAFIRGNSQLLDEMIVNLVDNAIKYNVEGGRVDIRITQTKDSVLFTVADTGIGIPKQYQNRVFERFYRVDKSHSKATGGTGLGLSIVKHSARYHHAALSLESEEGRGTTITLRFPKA